MPISRSIRRFCGASSLLAGVLFLTLAPSNGSLRAQSVPARVVPTWRLVEELRIGDDGSDATIFGEIRGLVSTKSGNIFVLDYKAKELRLFDARGKFLRVAARQGHGPGEMDWPTGLAVGNDDVVVLSDPGNGRFSYYSADGKYLRQVLISITGFGDYWNGVVDSSGRIVDWPVRIPTGGTDKRTGYPITISKARRIRRDGQADTVDLPACAPEPIALVYRAPEGYATSMALPYTPSPQTVISRSGSVWCTPRGEFRLFAGPIGGSLKDVVRLSVTPRPINVRERAAALEGQASFVRMQRLKLVEGDANAVPKTQPVINRLLADNDGRAWVFRNDLSATPPPVDVYALDGQHVAQLRDPSQIGRVVEIGSSHLLTTIVNADGVPVVVRYRIVR